MHHERHHGRERKSRRWSHELCVVKNHGTSTIIRAWDGMVWPPRFWRQIGSRVWEPFGGIGPITSSGAHVEGSSKGSMPFFLSGLLLSLVVPCYFSYVDPSLRWIIAADPILFSGMRNIADRIRSRNIRYVSMGRGEKMVTRQEGWHDSIARGFFRAGPPSVHWGRRLPRAARDTSKEGGPGWAVAQAEPVEARAGRSSRGTVSTSASRRLPRGAGATTAPPSDCPSSARGPPRVLPS